MIKSIIRRILNYPFTQTELGKTVLVGIILLAIAGILSFLAERSPNFYVGYENGELFTNWKQYERYIEEITPKTIGWEGYCKLHMQKYHKSE